MVRILFWIVLFPLVLFSQKESSNWYFGSNAGVKFNSDGSVTPLVDSQMYALEGCSSISDCDGNLLFYTNGLKIWNKNHQVMNNGDGLIGHLSCTQSATIIKKPGSQNLYYVFTSDVVNVGSFLGLHYSVVDINLNGGLGGVTSEKNILINSDATEKLCVIPHANGIDFWILSLGNFDDSVNYQALYKYVLNSSGVSFHSNQIVENISSQGCLKANQQGNRLVFCSWQKNYFTSLYKFDNATGLLFDLVQLQLGSSRYTSYGAEFSSNQRFLYLTISDKQT